MASGLYLTASGSDLIIKNLEKPRYLLRSIDKHIVATTYNFELVNYHFKFETREEPPSFTDNLEMEMRKNGVIEIAPRVTLPTLLNLVLAKYTDLEGPTDLDILPTVLGSEINQLDCKLPERKEKNSFRLWSEQYLANI